MCELVHAEAAAGAAGAFRIVEDEIARTDVAVDEMMRRAAQALVEALSLRLGRALADVDLEKSVAHEQRGGDSRANRLLVLPADHEPIDHRLHRLDAGGVDVHVAGDVYRLAVDDQLPAPLLPQLGEDDVELLAVDLEDRRPQLDLGARGQREDRFENLTGRSAGCRLPGPGTVRLADGGKQQIQIARDVGHRADGRAWIAHDGLLLDRNHRREAEHEIDVGLRDLRDETLGVARQRLHVAALPFGVNRVECQARLPRSGQAR